MYLSTYHIFIPQHYKSTIKITDVNQTQAQTSHIILFIKNHGLLYRTSSYGVHIVCATHLYLLQCGSGLPPWEIRKGDEQNGKRVGWNGDRIWWNGEHFGWNGKGKVPCPSDRDKRPAR